eukprot:1993167-Rhodomonas_salina.2
MKSTKKIDPIATFVFSTGWIPGRRRRCVSAGDRVEEAQAERSQRRAADLGPWHPWPGTRQRPT